MNEYQIRRALKKHWRWLKNTDAEEVAKFVITFGRLPTGSPFKKEEYEKWLKEAKVERL